MQRLSLNFAGHAPMAEPTSANGWVESAAKVGAGLAALLGAFKYLFRARATNANDRIRQLESQLRHLEGQTARDTQLRHDFGELSTMLESISARMRHNEVSMNDMKREMRDSIAELEDMVKRALRKFDSDEG